MELCLITYHNKRFAEQYTVTFQYRALILVWKNDYTWNLHPFELRNTVVIFVFGCVFQNVEEEKQHDWYKQMYKSLHRNKKKEGKVRHVENNHSKLEDFFFSSTVKIA